MVKFNIVDRIGDANNARGLSLGSTQRKVNRYRTGNAAYKYGVSQPKWLLICELRSKIKKSSLIAARGSISRMTDHKLRLKRVAGRP